VLKERRGAGGKRDAIRVKKKKEGAGLLKNAEETEGGTLPAHSEKTKEKVSSAEKMCPGHISQKRECDRTEEARKKSRYQQQEKIGSGLRVPWGFNARRTPMERKASS